MDNQLPIFQNPLFGEMRSFVDENDTPWFVGKDITTILGYKDPSRALYDHVDEEDKTTLLIQQSGSNYKNKTTLINESGLFSLILSSKLPQAKLFKHWVTSDVLPTIHKHGVYMSNDVIEKTLADPDYLIQVATVIKDERKRRYELEAQAKEQQKLIASQQSHIQAQDKKIEDMKDKVSYLDLILASKSSLNTTQIAQDYGMSAIKLNKILEGMGIQRKVNEQWILYAVYQGKGYISSHTINIDTPSGKNIVKMQTVWTPEGRKFLYNKLKEVGILPTDERAQAKK